MTKQEELINRIGQTLQEMFAKECKEKGVIFFCLLSYLQGETIQCNSFGNCNDPLTNLHTMAHVQLQMAGLALETYPKPLKSEALQGGGELE